jgi:polyphosphate kinase
VRVATILKKFRAGIEEVSIDGQSTEQQLATIRSRALAMIDDQTACWSQSLRPLLAAEGIHFLEPSDYTPAIDTWLANYFKDHIFPVLTPLAFDPGHPFPYISNLSMNAPNSRASRCRACCPGSSRCPTTCRRNRDAQTSSSRT